MKSMLTKTSGLLIAAGILAVSAAAVSGPKYMIERVYYSDATKTQVVGESIETCAGRTFVFFGTTSPYSTIVSAEPCAIIRK